MSSSTRARKPKRTKAIQACASCRKSKARCEVLDSLTPSCYPISCHRCKILHRECSYSEMDLAVLEAALNPPKPIPEQTPTEAQTNAFAQKGKTALSKPDDLFSFVDPEKDWRAPMASLRDIAKSIGNLDVVGPQVAGGFPARSLEEVLTIEQVQHLLNVYDTEYAPWSNFLPIRKNPGGILDLVCCTIASRSLPTPNQIAQRLEDLTETLTTQLILTSSPSTSSIEAIQSLLILATWDFRDRAKLFLGTAVGMAMSLELQKASEDVTRLRAEGYGPGGFNSMSLDVGSSGLGGSMGFAPKERVGSGMMNEGGSQEYMEAMAKARLWVCLTNMESLLCLGTSKPPLSKRCIHDINLFFIPSSPPDDPKGLMDYRTRVLAETLHLTEMALAVPLKSCNQGDVDRWYDEVSQILTNLGRLGRIVTPLPLIAHSSSTSHFYALQIFQSTCRILISYTAYLKAYRSLPEPDTPFWFFEVAPHGISVKALFAAESHALAEGILVSVLQGGEQVMRTPIVRECVGLAAAYIVGVKFTLRRAVGLEDVPNTDMLLSRTLRLLPPQCRYHRVIHRMIQIWEQRPPLLAPPAAGYTIEGGKGDTSSLTNIVEKLMQNEGYDKNNEFMEHAVFGKDGFNGQRRDDQFWDSLFAEGGS